VDKMEKVTTDFTMVGAGICSNIELTAKNGKLEIATINDCYPDNTDGISVSLDKEKVRQLRDFLNEWLENGVFIVPQPIDKE
jgi:hypothetical protein